jgi:hypothetical protein
MHGLHGTAEVGLLDKQAPSPQFAVLETVDDDDLVRKPRM